MTGIPGVSPLRIGILAATRYFSVAFAMLFIMFHCRTSHACKGALKCNSRTFHDCELITLGPGAQSVQQHSDRKQWNMLS